MTSASKNRIMEKLDIASYITYLLRTKTIEGRIAKMLVENGELFDHATNYMYKTGWRANLEYKLGEMPTWKVIVHGDVIPKYGPIVFLAHMDHGIAEYFRYEESVEDYFGEKWEEDSEDVND